MTLEVTGVVCDTYTRFCGDCVEVKEGIYINKDWEGLVKEYAAKAGTLVKKELNQEVVYVTAVKVSDADMLFRVSSYKMKCNVRVKY